MEEGLDLFTVTPEWQELKNSMREELKTVADSYTKADFYSINERTSNHQDRFPQIISPQTTRPLDVISKHHRGKFRNPWVRRNKQASSRLDSSSVLIYSC